MKTDMKSLQRKKWQSMIKFMALTVLSAAIATGCSKSTSNKDAAANPAAVVPIIIDPNFPAGGDGTGAGVTYSTGSTSTFKPVSLARMNEYVFTRPLNNPTNYKINVNLTSPGAGIYGGEVSISYVDNGITYNGLFKSGLGKNADFDPIKGLKYRYDNNKWESEYNFWFRFNNKTNFSGFFEDEVGAIAIVLEPQSATGGGNDAEPVTTTKYKGKIYFKNFLDTTGRPVFGPHPYGRSCWFTYTGAYDCRSNVVQTKCGLNPGVDAGYKLLGSFENVDVKTAFNISE